MGFFDSDIFHPGRWGGDISNAFGLGGGDPSNPDRDALRQLAPQQGNYGAQGLNYYGADRTGMGQTQDYLRGQMMGQNSVAAEQLRQGLQQGLAAQQSMAASASPQNAAMAARTAAIQMGRLSGGLSGQQALAGLQERNAAAQGLGQLQLGQSGQDLQMGLGGYGLANQAYGTTLGNPQKTWGGILGGAVGGFAGGLGQGIGKGIV